MTSSLPMNSRAGAGSSRTVTLSTENLTKSFGGVRPVDKVNVSFYEGELRCIIGPNGAGKSTLFKVLTGVHRPDSGRVLFHGRDITRLAPYQRVKAGMGIKFQNPRVYHRLTVGQNLEVPIRGRAERFWRLAEEEFSWRAKLDVPAEELSHSELQWLEISLVLACEPSLLLLDEPTAGMTPDDTHRTARFVRRLHEAGLTIIVVEHDMTFVKDIATTVTVLHEGRVFTEGTFEEVSADPHVRRIYLGQVEEG
jgi:branched-chain amino acid transport system ATP-binding protein